MGACASTPASSDDALGGTTWELRSLTEGGNEVEIVQPDRLHFDLDGNVSIRSCNICNGTYIAEGNRLMTGSMICTRRACSDEHPELAYLIGDISTYRLEGDWLVIETSGMNSMQLRFAPALPLEGE